MGNELGRLSEIGEGEGESAEDLLHENSMGGERNYVRDGWNWE